LFIEVPLIQNNHHSVHKLFFTYGRFLKSKWTILYPWKMLYLTSIYGQKNRLEMLSVFTMGGQGQLYQDN